jgi:hypothetical protein
MNYIKLAHCGVKLRDFSDHRIILVVSGTTTVANFLSSQLLRKDCINM